MVKISPMKRFRDAVHGDVPIFPHELLIINTQAYQRLHSIRQLDLAYKVYHDAVHTRFQHSIGTTHVVDQIIERVQKRGHLATWIEEFQPDYIGEIDRLQREKHIAKFSLPKDCGDLEISRHVVRLAALLHDVTHIPFGHMLENQLRLFAPHDAGHRLNYFLSAIILEIFSRNETNRKLVEHTSTSENVSYLLYLLTRAVPIMVELAGHADTDPSQPSVAPELPPTPALNFPQNLPEEFRWVITQINAPMPLRSSELFQADMIGNTICADLLDYIKRDNYFSGLWETYDGRLFHAFCLARVSTPDRGSDQLRLALQVIRGTVRNDTISNIMRVLELRYDLAEKIVFHHGRCAAGAMLNRAFSLSGMTSQDERLFYECGDDDALKLLVTIAEERQAWPHVDYKAVTRLITALKGRYLYKPFYRFSRSANESSAHGDLQRETIGFKLFRNLQDALNILQEVEKLAKLPVGSVVLYCPSPKMMLKETLAIVAGDADGAIPKGELLRDFVHRRLPVREKHIQALEERYAELWAATFFVHPEYRAYSPVLRDITMHLLQRQYGHVVPPPDPILEEQLSRLDTHERIEELYQVLEEITDSVLGDVVSIPATTGENETRHAVLSKLVERCNNDLGVADSHLPTTRPGVRKWLLDHSEVLLPHVRRQFRKNIDPLVDVIEWASSRASRKVVFEDLELRFKNESALSWNNIKDGSIVNLLRRKWGQSVEADQSSKSFTNRPSSP